MNMASLLCALLPWFGPVDHCVVCDEWNHVRHQDGGGFDQLIWWTWQKDGLHVYDWRFGTGAISVVVGNTRYIWTRDRVHRIRAAWRCETITTGDPELADRAHLPWCERIGLRPPGMLDWGEPCGGQ